MIDVEKSCCLFALNYHGSFISVSLDQCPDIFFGPGCEWWISTCGCEEISCMATSKHFESSRRCHFRFVPGLTYSLLHAAYPPEVDQLLKLYVEFDITSERLISTSALTSLHERQTEQQSSSLSRQPEG